MVCDIFIFHYFIDTMIKFYHESIPIIFTISEAEKLYSV